ncbi:SigB/SigF/SigG family RNA polymerase sigma factor [Roseburia hominis]|uniref:SigB/SigF/SigG family RNA polymerase sigma factor n=1 Tax=Roseburia hominis TaxID=301301 RepID=UPI001F21417C|nr:SigB/SigF/SigG family RNA polymerase sigma factor [Roseburia hominis]
MEQVIELIQKSQAGDKKAREQLVNENMGLVYSMVKRFENRGQEREELIQIGSIGLLKALDQFDCSYDVKFSTYAVPVICGEIRRFLRDDGMVKVSRSIKENARKVRQARQELQQTLGREAALSEISEKTGLSREEIVMALEASEEVESIYKTVYQSDGNEIFLVDQVVSGAEGVGQAIKGGQKDETGILLNKMLIKQLLEELDEEERKLISLRYFEDKTQKQVAEILGVNQVKVSRLEKKILLSMRKKLKE